MPKKQHQWDFMANPGSNGHGDLARCFVPSCRKWKYNDVGQTFSMTEKEYERMHQAGEIDATEVLGPRKMK